MAAERIGIIGAGMAGLACARALADAGHAPTILDKGRGIGGRLATRRTEAGYRFDHGAQFVTARDAGFAAALTQMCGAGSAGRWQDGSDREHIVGVPGMNALAKALAPGLDIRQAVEVASLDAADGGWQLGVADETLAFDRVVIAVPAPQAARLLGPEHPLTAEIGGVEIAPCLTLMVAFDGDAPRPFISRRDPADPIAWIAQDSTKPGRPDLACWVAQAGPDWSTEHLELEREEIAARMLPMMCARLGADPATVRYAAAHRWRYANVTKPLGRPFARDAAGSLHLCGDWCLDARVEAAWLSGTAAARDILDALG